MSRVPSRAPLLLALFSVAPVAAQEDVQTRMRTWSEALGVECEHCHTPQQWQDPAKPTYAFALRMMRMVDGLNVGKLKDLGGVTCWTCHRGQTRPARLPRESWQRIQTEYGAAFATRPERALAMSVYSASLGVECSHCHEADRWTDSSKPAHAMVRRMSALFDEIPTYFEPSRRPVLQCYLCHQGSAKPERTPR